jgi:hypothetical protein
MDRRERKRLENEIDRGMLNAGIRKVEEGAYERESRLPQVKGGAVGLSLSGPVAIYYGNHVGVFGMSPLGLFRDDYVLVMLGIVVGGTLLGAVLGWLVDKVVPKRAKPPKGAP